MSKSIYAIGGLGLATCLMLSLMMQHLLKVKTEKVRPAFIEDVEELFSGRLAGPVTARTAVEDGHKTLIVNLSVLAGLNKQRLGQSAGTIIWGLLAGGDEVPGALRIVLTDDEGGNPESVPVPKPLNIRAGPDPSSPPKSSQGKTGFENAPAAPPGGEVRGTAGQPLKAVPTPNSPERRGGNH